MRPALVIALALLSIVLTGGSCEFRASSGTPIHPPPPADDPGDGDSGLLIVVRAGDSIPPPNRTTSGSSTIAAALAASVLSVPDPPAPAPIASALNIRDRNPNTGASVTTAGIASIDRPIPEPSAILLFGLGTIFLGARVGMNRRRGVQRSAR